jgi:tetratricopeptide (TPR) repeat protein
LVFERVLNNAQDRFDEYMRILSHIDIDYHADNDALIGLSNAKELMKLFTDPTMIRQFYDAAKTIDPSNPSLLQQEAIFEKNRVNGNLRRAEELLQRAHEMAPYNMAITHSLSELALENARRSTRPLERRKYLEESKKIAYQQSGNSIDSYRYHTLIKVSFEELKDAQKEGDERSISICMKALEELISRAHQVFSDDPFILEMESQFAQFCRDNPRAIALLKEAFASNKQSPYIAIRLAKFLEKEGKYSEAVETLRECVEVNPSDKDVNFWLSMMLFKSDETSASDVKYHLRRSFTEGDTNFTAQFWYARLLYIERGFVEAKRIFRYLSDARIDTRIKKKPRGIIHEAGCPKPFRGVLAKKEYSYGFILCDGTQELVYSHEIFSASRIWGDLTVNQRVLFEMGFNYRGAVAVNIQSET